MSDNDLAGAGRRPLIGITTSELRTRRKRDPAPEDEPSPSEFALGVSYVRALERAGGVPVIVPPLEQPDVGPLLERIDGLCLPGGPDLDPRTYGAEEHPQLGPYEPEIDRFELFVARRADELGIPILAICRGAQVLNVARGGSLIQHLPDLKISIDHRQSTPGAETSHPVSIEPDSRLAAIVGAQALEVNSFHHQGIDRLGSGLRAVAFAPDGTIEALEALDRDFCVGVQWHAETLVARRPQAALFGSFVKAGASCARSAGAR